MSDLTFDEWKRLITSSEPADRSHAADAPPPKGPRKEIVRLLVKCLNDPHELVRACAADTLGMFPIKKARDALRAAVDREEDALAKAYALSSLGAVGTLDDIGRLAEALGTESNKQIRIHAALGLAFCVLGEFIENLLTTMKQEDRTRGTAANALGEYLNSHRAYVKLIHDTVKNELKKKDIPVNTRESMTNLLKDIEEIYKI